MKCLPGWLVGKITKVADGKDFVVIALNDQTEVTVQSQRFQRYF